MTRKPQRLALLALAITLVSCAAPPPRTGTAPAEATATRQPTTLVMVVNTEVKNLAAKAVGGVNPTRTTRLFSAGLSVLDAQNESRPYLAEALPQINTDDWIAHPDGRMETTWKLRSGLTWHDGQPLTADDFVLAFQIYTAPELAGIYEPRPQNLVDRVVAVDPRTIRIYWKSPYLFTGLGLDPLPRAHLAEPFAAFEQDPLGQRDTFLSLRFWTTEYVGSGPFRLTNWEPSSHLEGVAFDGHALGRPKIDKVLLRFINDENTVITNLLAGQVHLVTADVLRFESGLTLQRQGGFNDVEKKGILLPTTTAAISTVFQHRPDYQQTTAFHDLRVRKAMVHATDREAINDGLFSGQGFPAHTLVRRDAPYMPDVERVLTKYAYDVRITEQLMGEVGFSKDRDGFFVDAAGQRFQPAGLWAAVGPQREQLLPIMVNRWQFAGIDIQHSVLPPSVGADPEANATFPGLVVHGISLTESTSAQSLATEQIGTLTNRWLGGNRGGWSNPEYDRLWNRYNTTLVRTDQMQTMVQMMKLQSELVPSFPLYYLLGVVPHLASLKGPMGDSYNWNVHEWEITV